MADLMKLACLVLACMIVTSPITAIAALECSTVTSQVKPCVGYVMDAGLLSKECCTGVYNLNRMVLMSTTPDRQQACRCLQDAAKALGPGLDTDRTAGLPKVCEVDALFTISPRTDCNTVK